MANKRGAHGGLLAFRLDPTSNLLHVESPTKLHLGKDVVGYAIAFGIFAFVLIGAGTVIRRRRGVTVSLREGPESSSEEPPTERT